MSETGGEAAGVSDRRPLEFKSTAPVDRDGLKSLVLSVLAQSELDRMVDHSAFPDAAMRTMDGWAPQAEDDASMTRKLRDVGHYMAGLWALSLHGGPQGLSHASLSQTIEPLGVGSRTRAHAMIVYMRLIGLIRPLPRDGDARFQRFEPTPALRSLFINRFHREMLTCAELVPEVRPTLARWDEPGVFDAFMAAQGRFMTGSFLAYAQGPSSLDVISHRNAGLTILGQLMKAAEVPGVFPPPGPVQVNLTELARRTGASRAHVRNVLRAGADAGFLGTVPDGQTTFSADLRHQITYLMASYVLSIGWCARQALASTLSRAA